MLWSSVAGGAASRHPGKRFTVVWLFSMQLAVAASSATCLRSIGEVDMSILPSDGLVEEGAAIAKGADRSIDDAPLNRFHVKMTILTFGAHFTAGYVMGSIALALAGLCSCMEVSATWQGLLGSSALVGVFVGGVLTGLVSDKFGRQKIFLMSFVVITIAAALQYFATGPMNLFVLRIIVGMAIGADYSVGVTLLTEVLPRKERGPLLGCLVAVWTVGYVAASFAGVFVFAPIDWNMLLASSAIPAFIVLLLRAGTPESPRWLASKGRHEEAQAIIDEFIGEGYVLEEEPLTEKLGVKALFNRKTIRSLAFVCIFWSLNVIPYFGVYTFLPILLQELDSPRRSSWTSRSTSYCSLVRLPASFSLRNARAEYCPFPRLPSAAHALWCSPFFQKGQR